MGTRVLQCLMLLLLGIFFCSGILTLVLISSSGSSVTKKPMMEIILHIKKLDHEEKRLLLSGSKSTRQLDVITPTTTSIPMIDPMTPTSSPVVNPIVIPKEPTITTPITNPTTTSPVSSGGSWCIASHTSSQTALQVALDYACGYGGANCSAIQVGGSCYNPNTVRDHASFAFNDYYRKNPVSTSCNFGGTAIVTNIDPSSGTCQYPSTSTASSVLNTTNPTGARVYSSEPTGSTNSAASISCTLSLFISLTCLLVSLLAVNHF